MLSVFKLEFINVEFMKYIKLVLKKKYATYINFVVAAISDF